MDLRHLSDQMLWDNTESLARKERETLTAVLHHLREIERRRLFSQYKYQSLLDYAVRHLKYSEDQAVRRISAMRLLKELPEIEEKISAGSLTLTNIGLAQTLFNHEKKAGRELNSETKAEILGQFESKTTREAEKVARAICPEFKPKKTLNINDIEDASLREKLLRIQGKYAHSHPNMSLNDLLHMLCDKELAVSSPAAPRMNSKAEVKRQVWKRDECKCTNCGSIYAVQEDHRVPAAVGGKYTAENMRLLCRNCNQRAAIEFFGMPKMAKHLRSPETPYMAPAKCLRLLT